MMSGMSDARLEDIKIRLLGADHRPWVVSGRDFVDEEGRQMIVKGGMKARKKAANAAHQSAILHGGSKAAHEVDGGGKSRGDDEIFYDAAEIIKHLVLFRRSNQATDEMLDFIAHSPRDIEDLVNEVETLKGMVKVLKEKKDQAVAELQRYKVDASRAEGKIVDMRRAWRTLCKEMGTKPT